MGYDNSTNPVSSLWNAALARLQGPPASSNTPAIESAPVPHGDRYDNGPTQEPLQLIPRPPGGGTSGPQNVTSQVDPKVAGQFQDAIKAQGGDRNKFYSIVQSKGQTYGMSTNARWDDEKAFVKKDEIWKNNNGQWQPMFNANMVTDADDEHNALDKKFLNNGMSHNMRDALMYGDQAPVQ